MAWFIKAVKVLFLSVPLVLIYDLVQFDHYFFDAEVLEVTCDVQAPRQLAHDPRPLNTPSHIPLAHWTHTRVIIGRVKCLCLLLYG